MLVAPAVLPERWPEGNPRGAMIGSVTHKIYSYRYLGFTFHATKSMAYGAGQLVAAAKKAVHAMRRQCAHLHIRDPALQCKLFNSLILPILSYASEVWAVDPSVGAEAEVLHRQFLRHLLHVRKSTANEIVLAEFGRYPLQIHFWQQVLRFHNRALKLPDTRLVKLAFVAGALLTDGHIVELRQKGWRPSVSSFLRTLPGQLRVFQALDVTAIVDGQKESHQAAFLSNQDLTSLTLYRSLQPDYQYAHYLSDVQCFANRRLISRFRCGCHGLRVDTGRFGAVRLAREDRVCEVCTSASIEDELLFQCPAYAHIRCNHSRVVNLTKTCQLCKPQRDLKDRLTNSVTSNPIPVHLDQSQLHQATGCRAISNEAAAPPGDQPGSQSLLQSRPAHCSIPSACRCFHFISFATCSAQRSNKHHNCSHHSCSHLLFTSVGPWGPARLCHPEPQCLWAQGIRHALPYQSTL